MQPQVILGHDCNLNTNYGVVLAGHGSVDPAAAEEFEQLVALVKKRAPHRTIRHGYLEFCQPSIEQAGRDAVADGARQLVVVPALLSAALHAKDDMPAELSRLQNLFPDVSFCFGAVMELHPLLLKLCQERIIEAEAQSPATFKRSQTCLVVVGRGTSDPDANSQISKLARMLEEGMGFGASFVCYAGMARPLVLDGLFAAARLGLKRIIVLPYLLFNGVLVKRIYAAADELRARHHQIEVLKTGYLGVHDHVADVFLERAHEGIEGRAHMNCSLCKYRVQIVGYESQVGASQKGGSTMVVDDKTGAAVEKAAPLSFAPGEKWLYKPHPIEAQSMEIIDSLRDWSGFDDLEQQVLKRLVHTSGDCAIVDQMFISSGALKAGVSALLRCRRVVTDATMVQSGLKRELLTNLDIKTWCGVHEQEVFLMSREAKITRSAAGIRAAFQKFGNDVVLAIGDAPTAVFEALRLVAEEAWRPQLLIGLPVGFVGTAECKEQLRNCLHVPRVTNSGTRGGSPWASAVVNALMIAAMHRLWQKEENEKSAIAGGPGGT